MIISICDICGSEIKEKNVKLLDIRSAVKNNILKTEIILNECHENCIDEIKRVISNHIHAKKTSNQKPIGVWTEAIMHPNESEILLKGKIYKSEMVMHDPSSEILSIS